MLEEFKGYGVEFHIYTLPSLKTLKTVVKGISPNVKAEDIKAEITDNGLAVINIKQVCHFDTSEDMETETKLPVLTVEFSSDTIIKDSHIIQCYKCHNFDRVAKNCLKNISVSSVPMNTRQKNAIKTPVADLNVQSVVESMHPVTKIARFSLEYLLVDLEKRSFQRNTKPS